MGSPCALHLYADDDARAEALFETCLAEVARLEAKYSRYRDDSITSELNRSAGDAAGVRLDDETASLIDYAETAHAQSGGLFDITSGVLREVWDFRGGRVPRREEVARVLTRVGWRHVAWSRPRLVLPIAGMQIDFGGYVKEYAADRVAALCREAGCRSGLVDLGGDLAVVGPHPDGSPWRVGIRDPRSPADALARVDVFSGGIATSGDYERCMIVDGIRYAHLLDPRSGWPVVGLAAVSVLASHCLIAGTAASIGMLKGAEGPAWLDALGLPHVRVDGEGRLTRRLRMPARRSPAPGPRRDDAPAPR